MLWESLLAYAHLVAILTLVVFVSSEAALCRVEWMNAAVVERLATIDRVVQGAGAAIIVTGFARAWWGMKGDWYWGQPLFWTKVVLFVGIALMSQKPARAFVRWRRQLRTDGTLPPADEVRAARRTIIGLAHVLVLIPLAAVFLARGVLAR